MVEEVSIHAPARRATGRRCSIPLFLSVSIHAPARRATPVGGLAAWADDVSIHAPARRATSETLPFLMGGKSFNPRPRTEGD